MIAICMNLKKTIAYQCRSNCWYSRIFAGFFMMVKKPELLKRRLKGKETQKEQGVIVFLSAVMFAIGFPMITGNFYTSIGMAPKAIFLSLTRQVLFLIPLIIGLPLLFESLGIAPIWGVWWSWPISDSLSVITAMIVFNRDMRKFKFLNQQPI